jgi:hypothetical protein
MSTFREAVEEIIDKEICVSHCGYCSFQIPDCRNRHREKAVSRILAAYKAELERIAKGAKQIKNPYLKATVGKVVSNEYRIFNMATKNQCKADQSYLLKEIE